MIFELGEVKIPNDQDLEEVSNLCQNDEGWHLEFTKKNTKVFLKKNELSSFQMIKAKVDFDDVPIETAFNVMMDCQYRYTWDEYMVEGFDHCYINANSDIGYYCAKSPKPLKNRDFVMQRSWIDGLVNGYDKIILSHSINHTKLPPRPKRVRGLIFLSACYLKYNSPKSCSLYYVSQTDPGGSIPTWIVNKTTKSVTPKFVKKIHKACLGYEKWKSKQGKPYLEPWKNTEDLRISKYDKDDISILDLSVLKSVEDEGHINEKDFELDD